MSGEQGVKLYTREKTPETNNTWIFDCKMLNNNNNRSIKNVDSKYVTNMPAISGLCSTLLDVVLISSIIKYLYGFHSIFALGLIQFFCLFVGPSGRFVHQSVSVVLCVSFAVFIQFVCWNIKARHGKFIFTWFEGIAWPTTDTTNDPTTNAYLYI